MIANITGYRTAPQQRRIIERQRPLMPFEQLVIRLEKGENLTDFEEALKNIIATSDTFSTGFYFDAGQIAESIQIPSEQSLVIWNTITVKTIELNPFLQKRTRQGFQPDKESIGYIDFITTDTGDDYVAFTFFAAAVDVESLLNIVRQARETMRGSETEEEALPYINYAEWQHQLRESEEGEESLRYWKNLDASSIINHHLALENKKLQVESEDLQWTTLLKLEGNENQAPESISALWWLFLSRFSNNMPVPLSYRTNGRDFEELDDCIGRLNKNLPIICTALELDQTIEQLAKLFNTQLQLAIENKDGLDPTSFYLEKGIDYLPYSFEFIQMKAIDDSITHYLSSAEPFRLKLMVFEKEGIHQFQLAFDTHFYQPQTAQYLQKCFAEFYKNAIANPNQTLKEIALVSKELEDQLIEELILPSIPSINNSTTQAGLLDTFLKQVKTYPDHLAVVGESESLTYAVLDRRSDSIARLLHKKGVKEGDFVGLFLGEDCSLAVAMMATLKSGAAFLPIDPENPSDRITMILEDSQPKVLITESDKIALLPSEMPALLLIDKVKASADPVEPFKSERSSAATAYVIYTSGTTGKPKGVMVSDTNLMNYAQWFIQEFGIQANDSSILLSSYAYDLGYTSIWGCWLSGGTLHLPADNLIREPDELVNYILNQKISFLKLTPSLFYLLTTADTFSNIPNGNLRLVLMGGEPIVPNHVQRLLNLSPKIMVVNHYGPTETTIGTIFKKITTENIANFTQNPVIGKAVTNNQVWITDKAGRVVPPGIRGEIAISGAGLSKGYYERPELTASKFIKHPYLPNQSLYRTGDVGYWNQSGDVVFLGRNDGQIKIRGHRIELGEVKQTVLSHPKIVDLHLRVLETDNHSKELVAYAISDNNFNDKAQLRSYLSEKIPEHMIPGHFVFMDQFPLTPNGKLDSKQLPNPLSLTTQDSSDYKAPSTELEKEIVEVWVSILKKELLGVSDNFFLLGGDSIKAIRIVSKLKKRNIQTEIRSIFEFPTIEDLIKNNRVHYKESHTNANVATEKTISLESQVTKSFGLAAMQEGMYFLHKTNPTQSLYLIQKSFDFRGNQDAAYFEKMCALLVQNLEILRTNFVEKEDGSLRQEVWENRPIDYEFINLTETSDAEAVFEQSMKTDSDKPFDLSKDNLIRFKLFKFDEKHFRFSITYHHILMDGWCFQEIAKDFFEVSAALIQGQKVAFTPRPSFEKYINWLEKQDKVEAHAYWQKHLEELTEETLLPFLNTASSEKTDFKRSDLFLGKELTEALSNQAKQLNISYNALIQAVWSILLARYNNRNDVTYGLTFSGRPTEIEEIESMLGLFINTLPIRVQFEKEATVAAIAKSVQIQLLEHYNYQYIPLYEIQKRSALKNNLINHLFVFENYPVFESTSSAEKTDSDIQSAPVASPFQSINYDLMVVAFPDEEGQTIFSINFNETAMPSSAIDRLKTHFRQALHEVAQNTNQLARTLNFMSETEIQQLTQPQVDTFPTISEDISFIEKLQEKMELFKQQEALFDGNTSLTFGVLNAQSNEVAHWLQTEHSVSSKDKIGLLFKPSIEMLTSILGIMKTGATYVPIDPDWPKERIQFILEDSNCKAIIGQEAFIAQAEKIPFLAYPDAFGTENLNYQIPSKVSDSPVYMIYTSGSTGKPKGCKITNSNLYSLMEYSCQPFGFAETDRWVMAHSYAFDFSVWEIFACWYYGGRLFLPTRDSVKSIPDFWNLLKEQNITILNQTPAAFYGLTEIDANQHERLDSLRMVIFGGDKLNFVRLKNWYSKYPLTAVQLINMYGITETTVHVSIKKIEEEALEHASHISNIGTAINGAQMYVLDKKLNLLPPGCKGEIYVGGNGVCAGYHNRPDLTQERFLDNPFQVGTKMYKTGDVGRYLANFDVEYLGRNDHQVQVRGFRIELGAIENAFKRLPNIKDIHILHEALMTNDTPILLAFYTCTEENGVTTALLKEQLRQYLPTYFIPDRFVRIDQIPLNHNGKPDKKALLQYLKASPSKNDTPIEALSSTGQQLAKIWCETLEVSTVQRADNFFEVGGHSLLAIRLITKIQKELKIELPLTFLMEHPIFGEVVAEIEKHQAGKIIVEMDYAILNKGIEPTIFVFPAAVGYAVGYEKLARHLENRVIGFNFINNGHPIESYLEHVKILKNEEPIILAGLSAGGSLAFNVAKQLEKENIAVSDLIFLDCRRHLEPEPLSPEQIEEVVKHYITDPRAVHLLGSESLKEKVKETIRKSTDFIHNLTDHGLIEANIHIITSEENHENVQRIEDWRAVTTGEVFMYKGAGSHTEMLDENYFDVNATYFKQILKGKISSLLSDLEYV